MHAHTAGHGDTHRQNVAVHPCTQTDKVDHWLGLQADKFHPASLYGLFFLFCCWGFIWGQQ